MCGKFPNSHMHEMGRRIPSTIFLTATFTWKMLERSDSMYSSIFLLDNYNDFSWNGPNSLEILGYVYLGTRYKLE